MADLDTPASGAVESGPVESRPAESGAVGSDVLPEPGERGSLVVKDRVVERIAQTAARRADGVVPATTGITRRSTSRIKLSRNNSHVQAEVATAWPRSASEVGEGVRSDVAAALVDAGVTASRIDVHVTSVTADHDRRGNVGLDSSHLPLSLPPRSRPAAAPVVLLLSLLLIALGVVAVRDALVAASAISGTSWSLWVVDAVDGATPGTWTIPVAVALAVVGLLVLIAALKPRAKPWRPVHRPDVWIDRKAAVTLSRGVAETVPGVSTSRVRASAKAVTVHATGPDGARDQVRSAVEHAVSVLDPAPSVSVRLRADVGAPAVGGPAATTASEPIAAKPDAENTKAEVTK